MSSTNNASSLHNKTGHIQITISLTTDQERPGPLPFLCLRPSVSTHIKIAYALTEGWRTEGAFAYEMSPRKPRALQRLRTRLHARLPHAPDSLDDAPRSPRCSPARLTLATCSRSLPSLAYHRRAAFLASAFCRWLAHPHACSLARTVAQPQTAAGAPARPYAYPSA